MPSIWAPMDSRFSSTIGGYWSTSPVADGHIVDVRGSAGMEHALLVEVEAHHLVNEIDPAKPSTSTG